jgi:translation initiation factor 2 subunit 2
MADDESVQPTHDDNEALDFGKKKKKKKAAKEDLIKDDATVAPATAAATPATEGEAGAGAGDDDLDFGKKKKSKNKVVFDDDQNEVHEIPTKGAELDQASSKKKEDQNALSANDNFGQWQGTDRDYSYEELLTRVFNIMREKNPDMITGEKRKFVMKPPQVNRIGTKKTSFSNFADICKLLRRQEKHLLNFLLVELGTSGSLDMSKQLTIKGKFQQKQIENVLRRYIKEYVTCHTCRSPDTIMVKEERLFFLKCEACGATCSVASIKSGFQAQVGKRAALRAKQ